tara:strand:- start:1820 stop:2662 length:843 start_codon:yes stop_codon:yes gene_type:complete
MNCQTLLNKATNILKDNSIINPTLDSEILLSSVLRITREKLLLNLEKKITDKEIKKFDFVIEKRKKKEPLAYILGKKEFWKTNFLINKNVLIPRPDTEILVEEALNCLKIDRKYQVLDVGTGSGCILISVLKERKKSKGIGIDISKDAIHTAKTNAKIQQLENRIRFIHSDIDKFYGTKYDLILSNPPYISTLNLRELSEDIRNYEPILALDGGSNGYSKIIKVIEKSSKLIKIKGKLILEIGIGQLNKSMEILRLNGFFINKVSKDLAGTNRCILSTKI